jgi:hypothetical protein
MKETKELANAISVIRKHLAEADCDIDRENIIEKIKKGYCRHCMGKHLPCYCWNDT